MRDLFKLCDEAAAEVTKGPHGWIKSLLLEKTED